MADFNTVTELLISQTDRKLNNLRGSIVSEITRLQGELRLVEEALRRKRARSVHDTGAHVSNVTTNGSGTTSFEGLPSHDLLAYVREVDKPVSASEMREVLEAKGITRTTEAVRTALTRLRKRGLLVRASDGRFAVPTTNTDGTEVEGPGLSSQVTLGDGYPPGASDG
jgi:hypothetical protein